MDVEWHEGGFKGRGSILCMQPGLRGRGRGRGRAEEKGLRGQGLKKRHGEEREGPDTAISI